VWRAAYVFLGDELGDETDVDERRDERLRRRWLAMRGGGRAVMTTALNSRLLDRQTSVDVGDLEELVLQDQFGCSRKTFFSEAGRVSEDVFWGEANWWCIDTRGMGRTN